MIRKITENDRESYIDMAETFYASPAVLHNIPKKHIEDTFEEMMRSDIYAEGYIVETEEKTAGYMLIAKTYSQEAGGLVIWIEEIYIKDEFRGMRLGKEAVEYIKNSYMLGTSDSENEDKRARRIRLEVEDDNERAVGLYKKLGFENLEYSQMINDSM